MADEQPIPQTPEGEIKDVSQQQEQPKQEEQKPSIVNVKDEAAKGAPEKYEDFKTPEGTQLDTAVVTEATGLFKEFGLTQTQAQKLVDFYVGKTNESAQQPYQAWQEMQAAWISEVQKDPEIGGKLPQVRSTINKAIDNTVSPKAAQGFREAMDFTGAGNHPAFVRFLYEWAKSVTEGGHVSGGPSGESRQGQPGSAAKALYPNLS